MNGDSHNTDDLSSSINRERMSIYQLARLPPCISEFNLVLCATAELTSLQLAWDLNTNKSDKISQDPVLHIKDYAHSCSWYIILKISTDKQKSLFSSDTAAETINTANSNINYCLFKHSGGCYKTHCKQNASAYLLLCL